MMNSFLKEQKQYWAFISYSSKDRRWGEWLHRRLENYPIPADFRGLEVFDGSVLGKNLRPVFRDRDELAGSSDLGEAIGKALDASRFLVVLCSKNAAKSKWVNKEIADFQAMGKGGRILALILDGEPNATETGNPDEECFPPALRYPVEPIAGDLRKEGDGKARGFLKILAGIAQLDFDKLYCRHERAQARKRLLSGVIAVALVALFGALAAFAWSQKKMAETQMIVAEERRVIAAQKTEEAIQREKEARHNLGIIFTEKAEKEIAARNYNGGRVFALYALKNLKHREQARANSLILNHPIYPCIFTSPSPPHHETPVASVAFSPDGRTLASGSEDKTIRIWDVVTGHQTAVLAGHKDGVFDIAYSPDGAFLASGSADKTIRLWDAVLGSQTAVLEGHMRPVISVAFSPDNHTVVSGSQDGTIRLWDTTANKENAVISDLGFINCVAFSPDGQTIASGVRGRIHFWDLRFHEQLTMVGEHAGHINSVAFSPDGRTIASGAGGFPFAKGNIVHGMRDHSIRLWDVATGEQIGLLDGHTGWIISVAFSPDGRTLASGSEDNTIRLWDVGTGRPIAVLKGHTDWCYSVVFSPDGLTLASGSADSTIRLWDAAASSQNTVLEGHLGHVTTLDFSLDGRVIASRSRDTFCLRDLATGKQIVLLKDRPLTSRIVGVSTSPTGDISVSEFEDPTLIAGEQPVVLPVHIGDLSDRNQLAWSPDGHTLAMPKSNTVLVWDVVSGETFSVLDEDAGKITCVSFSPDGRTLASGSEDKLVRLWDVATKKQTTILQGHMGSVSGVHFSPNGRLLATSSTDNTLRLWNVVTGQQTAMLGKEHGVSVNGVAFSPDARTIATRAESQSSASDSERGVLAEDCIIQLWDTSTGRQNAALEGHANLVTSMVFSPDGQTVASGSELGTIRLWEASSGQQVALLEEHAGRVNSLAFSPDGRILASGSGGIYELETPDAATIRLWDTATGKLAGELEGHTGPVSSVVFSPDGRILASGSYDKNIRLWDISFLFDSRPLDEIIRETEQSLGIRMDNLDIRMNQEDIHLFRGAPPSWPELHPFHWLTKAEAGESNAMLELGIRYHRSGNWKDARHWYERAKIAEHPDAKQRISLLERHESD